MAITVVIVDDHPAFRASARSMLELDGFVVLGEAGDSASGEELTRRLQPDLVLLDVVLPDGSGFDVAERLARAHARSRVILTSSREQSDYGRRVRRSGALGFVSKDRLSGAALSALLAGVP